MSTNIDFLPSRYREQDVRRQSRLWLVSILGIFVCLIAVTSAVQMAFHRKAEAQLQSVEFQYSSAQATQQRYNRVQARLADARAAAQLYAFLEGSWPRTQIVLAVARPLTDEITLTELNIILESGQTEERSQRQSRRRRSAPETEQPTGLPAERDLKTLRGQLVDKRTVVHLSGTTTDDVALHRYVSRLNNGALFDKAELLSFESEVGPEASTAEFLVRIVVRDSGGAPAKPATSAVRQEARSGLKTISRWALAHGFSGQPDASASRLMFETASSLHLQGSRR